MKADITRSTFRPEKHYRSVRMQQGRVQLDADWNEQTDIGTYLDDTTRVDVIGRCGAPVDNAGFGLDVTPDGSDLTLSPGRLYAEGVLCELESAPVVVTSIDVNGAKVSAVMADGRELLATDWVSLSAQGTGPFVVKLSAVDVAGLGVTFSAPLAAADVDALKAAGAISLRHVTTYTTQPEPHDDLTAAVPQGTYVAFVDQWERLRTALDDGRIRETALGGPDTATREQTVWQVRLLRVGEVTDDISCASVADLEARLGESTALLRARTKPEPAAQPCLIPDAAGYSGLESQAYRVEIHDGGALGVATFKWSRENGSVVTSWDAQDGANLTVGSLGRDGNLSIKAGDWIELTDDTHELRGVPGTVVRVLGTTAPATITIEQPATPVSIADFPLNRRVRRWDDPQGLRKVEQPAANGGYLPGESAIEWRFEGDEFSPGDHWLVPARTGIGIEWPTDSAGTQLAKPPDGIRHHYCPLAIVRRGAAWEVVSDCRKLFHPLTDDGAAAEAPGIHVVRVRTPNVGILANDTELLIRDLLEGIEIVTDGHVEARTVIGKPTCFVTIDLPFPTSDAVWGGTPAGTIPLTLAGELEVSENVIRWLPVGAARQWLSKDLPNGMRRLNLSRVLLHLTLKGNFVYETGEPAHNVDGEAFGVLNGNVLDAKLPSGDKRRGGNLDLWYWLTPREVDIRRVALATHPGSRVLETAVKRMTIPLAIGLAADRAPLAELLPPDFELDQAAVLDVPKAHQLLSVLQVGAAVLRTAVEAPLVPLAERLNELLSDHHMPIRLDIVRVDDFSTLLPDLVAQPQGLDLVVAGADTLDAFDATERAAFAEEGRVML